MANQITKHVEYALQHQPSQSKKESLQCSLFTRVNLCAFYAFVCHSCIKLNLLLGDTTGQRLHLLLEELLGALPDGRAGAVLQRQQARQQRVAEGLGRLTRQRRRQVVN